MMIIFIQNVLIKWIHKKSYIYQQSQLFLLKKYRNWLMFNLKNHEKSIISVLTNLIQTWTEIQTIAFPRTIKRSLKTTQIMKIHSTTTYLIVFSMLVRLSPCQTSNKKLTFLKVKSAHFNALKKLFCEKKASWYTLMLLNLFLFKKNLNVLKCALFTRKNIIFFVTCLTGASDRCEFSDPLIQP
jgi:hypothetical protein